jgi:hypothetical protein
VQLDLHQDAAHERHFMYNEHMAYRTI